jgi:hypothetical protein
MAKSPTDPGHPVPVEPDLDATKIEPPFRGKNTEPKFGKFKPKFNTTYRLVNVQA